MTPSGPNNQSFLLRIAPATPQVLKIKTGEEFEQNKTILRDFSDYRFNPFLFNNFTSIFR